MPSFGRTSCEEQRQAKRFLLLTLGLLGVLVFASAVVAFYFKGNDRSNAATVLAEPRGPKLAGVSEDKASFFTPVVTVLRVRVDTAAAEPHDSTVQAPPSTPAPAEAAATPAASPLPEPEPGPDKTVTISAPAPVLAAATPDDPVETTAAIAPPPAPDAFRTVTIKVAGNARIRDRSTFIIGKDVYRLADAESVAVEPCKRGARGCMRHPMRSLRRGILGATLTCKSLDKGPYTLLSDCTRRGLAVSRRRASDLY
jgi:hypothetical protein